MKKYHFITMLGIFLLSACTSPKDTPLPENIEDPEAFTAIRPVLDKLSSEERDLAQKYFFRRLMGAAIAPAFGVVMDPQPKGMTVGDAIEAQKSYDARVVIESQKQAAADAQRKAEKIKAESSRRAMLEEIKSFLAINLTEIVFHKADYVSGDIHDQITFAISVENKGSKSIVGLKGNLAFKDKFGDMIYNNNMKTTQKILPKQITEIELAVNYNRFMADDVKLAGSSIEDLDMIFTPTIILFEDGSKFEIPSLAE